jgi:hypothetical protein
VISRNVLLASVTEEPVVAETSSAAVVAAAHYMSETADEVRWPLCVDQFVGRTVAARCWEAVDHSLVAVADILDLFV